MNRTSLAVATLVLCVVSGWCTAAEVVRVIEGSAETIAAPSRVVAAVREKIKQVFDEIEKDGDFVAAEIELVELFDGVIGYAGTRDIEAFREAAFAVRLVRQLAQCEEPVRKELFSFLRVNPDFARALAFVAKPEEENMAGVYNLANRLRRERGDSLNTFANLAAAICVVHDQPLRRNYNENFRGLPDAIALFDFYVANETRLLFGLKDVPAELLIYVVDVTAELDDLRWALSHYHDERTVGQLFFDIQYDHEHYKTGAPKKSTQEGWGLENIAMYGGVCADQAYFAVTVGKAIGVPTAYTIGRNADVGHAWVGYLQANQSSAWWNFSEGRYGAYIGLRGVCLDPQTHNGIADGLVSLLADFSRSPRDKRQDVAALTDAVLRLQEVAARESEWKPEAVVPSSRSRAGRPLREPSSKWQLKLLETGLRETPGYAPAWYVVAEMAERGELVFNDKKRWAEVLSRLCGRKYPDFSLEILRPMIESVEEVKRQNSLWNSAFRQFQNRPDLAAEVRMAQASMWEEADEIESASQCYMDVISRFANDGPFIVDALVKAEGLLSESQQPDKTDKILQLYADAWSRIKRPEQMAGMFAVQSNWFRVGRAYATRLEAAGQTQEATRVKQIIGVR